MESSNLSFPLYQATKKQSQLFLFMLNVCAYSYFQLFHFLFVLICIMYMSFVIILPVERGNVSVLIPT